MILGLNADIAGRFRLSKKPDPAFLSKALTQSQKRVTQKQKMARRLAWEIVIRINEL